MSQHGDNESDLQRTAENPFGSTGAMDGPRTNENDGLDAKRQIVKFLCFFVVASAGLALLSGVLVGIASSIGSRMEILLLPLVFGSILWAIQSTALWSVLGTESYLKRSLQSLVVCCFLAIVFLVGVAMTEGLPAATLKLFSIAPIAWGAAQLPCLFTRLRGAHIGPWQRDYKPEPNSIGDLFIVTFYVAATIAIANLVDDRSVLIPVAIVTTSTFLFGSVPGLLLISKPTPPRKPTDPTESGCAAYAVYAITMPIAFMIVIAVGFGAAVGGEILALLILSVCYAGLFGATLLVARHFGLVLYTRRRVRKWQHKPPAPYTYTEQSPPHSQCSTMPPDEAIPVQPAPSRKNHE